MLELKEPLEEGIIQEIEIIIIGIKKSPKPDRNVILRAKGFNPR